MALIGTLVDDFNGTTLDAAKWTSYIAAGGAVSVSGGAVNLTVGPAAGGVASITSAVTTYTVAGSSAYVKVAPMAATAGINVSFALTPGAASGWANLRCVDGQMSYWVAGFTTVSLGEAYNPATWVYWRISVSAAGLVTFGRSADAVTWTTFNTGSSIPTTAAFAALLQLEFSTSAVLRTIAAESFNMVPAAAPIVKTFSDRAGATDTATVKATRTSTRTDLAGATDAVTVVLTDNTPPTTPGTPVVSAATSTSCTLTWTGSTDNVGVTGYRVYKDGVLYASPAGLTTAVTGLTVGVTYAFTVRAIDAAGNLSSPSGAASHTVPDTTPPTTPGTPVVSNATPTSLTLTWTGSTDNVGVGWYRVYESAINIVASPTGLTTNVTGLTPGVTYVYTVKARDAANNYSSASGAVAFTGRTFTDLAGTTDAVTVRTTRTTTRTDLAGTTDAVTFRATRLAAVTDNAGVSDVATVIKAGNALISRTDLAGTTDALTLTAVRVMALTDPAGTTDSVTVGQAGNVTLSRTDLAGTSDSVTVARSAVSAYADLAGTTDSLRLSLGRTVPVADQVDVSDSVTVAVRRALVLTDRAGTTDNVSVLGAGKLTITDRAGTTDQVTLTAVSSKALADNAGTSDAVRISMRRTVELADVVDVTDQLRLSTGQTVRFSDTAGTSDTVAKTLSAVRRYTDRAGTSDAVTVRMQRYRTIIDNAGISDALLVDGRPPYPDSFDLWATADLGMDTITIRNAPIVVTVPHGRRERDWASAVSTTVIRCSVQPYGATEMVADREFTSTHVRLFAPPGVTLTANSRVVFAGISYEVDGEPGSWRDLDGRPSHIEASLKRLAG